jgi:ankyrin repeat protein
LAIADLADYLPSHRLLRNTWNKSSYIDVALIVIEKYPAALQHQNDYGKLPLHIECEYQCRSYIISKCTELYPESLGIHAADKEGYLPLNRLLGKQASSVDFALKLIEKYPAALGFKNLYGDLPLHVECIYQCRSDIISKCYEIYPESLNVANGQGCLSMHHLLANKSSSIDYALMMIEKYPVALQHQSDFGEIPLHCECKNRCRLSNIAKCIELYPESLSKSDDKGYLPLHLSLRSPSYKACESERSRMMHI